MDIFIYSDESGVFDKQHNDLFVFGGVILLSKSEKDICARKYVTAEKVIRTKENFKAEDEVKATTVTNSDKGKLYRSLNHIEKFGVIINEKQVLNNIFGAKKSKQRYLDYAYKIAIKRKFENLISRGLIEPNKVTALRFYVDEHTTATDGRYELKEALEQEFKMGTYNWNYSKFFPPLFKKLETVELQFCNSTTVTLVRSADIVANKLYYCAKTNTIDTIKKENFNIITLP